MEEDKLIESKKILTDYMLELNNDIQRAEDLVNTGADEEMYFALQTVLNELEKLQKEKNTMLEDITKMNNYIEDLQKMVNWGDIVITECPECNKKFTINCCREVQNLKEKVNELQKNALNSEKTVHTCLHCGNDTPLYCEKCHQELITKNAELQLKNEELITYCKKCIIIDRLNEYVENSIPKQDIKDKIEELYSYIEENSDEQGYWGDKNPEELYMEIHFLEELLGGE